MARRVNAATAIRQNLEAKGDGLTAEDVATELERYGDDAQDILDVWNGTADASLSADNVADFLKQRVDASVAATREEADGASREDAPSDLRFVRALMETGSADAARRMENDEVRNLAEYRQLVTEMSSILSLVQALRDPATRTKLHPQQIQDIPTLVRRLQADATQARTFLDLADDHGFDTSGLDDALREQLGKFGATDLADPDPTLPQELVQKGNRDGQTYRRERDKGRPAADEATRFAADIRDILNASDTPSVHQMLEPGITKLVADQIASNGGTMPDPLREVLQDPVFARFGAYTGVLQRADLESMIKAGDVDLAEATNGRYTTVDWVAEPQLSSELVTDDRPEGSGSVEADMAWDEGMAQLTPNVASALNSMFTSMGGGIHRVQSDITEANIAGDPVMQGWQNRSGSDRRMAEQVEGAYLKDSNSVVIADSRAIADTGTGSHVIVHELGHALDSMLGEMSVEGSYFTEHDPEFKKFHASLKQALQYGRSPEQSLLHWYFRNEDEGAIKHNGRAGAKEIFAEGYAAYAAGLQRLEQLPEGSGPISKQTAYVLIGRQLTQDRGQLAEWAGELDFKQVRQREYDVGVAIMDFFGDLEENRLPKLMSEPRPMPVRSEMRNVLMGMDFGAVGAPPTQKRATAEQKQKSATHLSKKHGLIQMTPIERGSPEWQQMEAAVKQASPGATLPPPTAIYVTWNPSFAEQGASVIWKAVMGGHPKYTVEYTDEHKATQLAAKFQRQQRVNSALDTAHAKAETEAMFDETAALVLAMIETGMRVGSSEKAGSTDRKTGKKIPTFGGATMQAKHVFFPSDTLMRFKFPGKAGTPNVYESRNPVLRAAVMQLLEGKKPSDQVFAGTNSGRTIDYLREATGIEDVINHDTRTRFATNMARELVAKWPKSRLPKDEKSLKKAETEVAKKVGAAINDTWTVARDSYISNAVWERFEDSAGVPHSFDESPPYGLIEGEVVQSIGGPPVAVGPTAPEAPAPAGPVAAALDPQYLDNVQAAYANTTIDDQTAPDEEGEGYSLDHSPEAVAERAYWYGSYVWPDPPIVAGPDTTFSAEDGDDEPAATGQPAAETETEEVT